MAAAARPIRPIRRAGRPLHRLARGALIAAALLAGLAGCREKHDPLKPTVGAAPAVSAADSPAGPNKR
ncbi:hypothetical protein [Massilia sp. DWR3-1-1]|uniref:hypothetical protein n=1 Tax=Massilia sp. DWR3-1-1 TaxID=2804559 RepID=UPI003CF9BA0C